MESQPKYQYFTGKSKITFSNLTICISASSNLIYNLTCVECSDDVTLSCLIIVVHEPL